MDHPLRNLDRDRSPEQLPRHGHGLPAPAVLEHQRARILSAVADVASAASYAEMTVEDIVVTAGVSRRGFYDLFENKEGAFLAAYDEAVGRLLSVVRRACQAEHDFAECVFRAVHAVLGYLALDPALARMCVVEAMAAGPEIPAAAKPR